MEQTSDSFRPIHINYEDTTQFTHPELLYITSGARLYRARKSGKFFMLKTPKEDSAMYIDLLHREYELSIGLSHPNIIQVYTYEPESCVGPCIVMEYVSGRNLADFLMEHPPLEARIRVFEQILDAVDCMHQADVIHNDLKPQNILITHANNDAKLIDFGLSDDSAHYLNQKLGGSMNYISPELLSQEGEIDTRSDIYSIGRLMRDLFDNRYGSIRRKCMQEDREKRYANIRELRKAWHRRKLPRRIALGILLALLFIVPSVLYTYEHFYRTELESVTNRQKQHYDSVTHALKLQMAHEQQLRKEMQDSIAQKKAKVNALIQSYDGQSGSIVKLAKDSIRRTPYYELRLSIQFRALKRLSDLRTKFMSEISEPEINSQIGVYMEKKYFKFMDELQETCEKTNGRLPKQDHHGKRIQIQYRPVIQRTSFLTKHTNGIHLPE